MATHSSTLAWKIPWMLEKTRESPLACKAIQPVHADDARGWQCPFVLCLHPQGQDSKAMQRPRPYAGLPLLKDMASGGERKEGCGVWAAWWTKENPTAASGVGVGGCIGEVS